MKRMDLFRGIHKGLRAVMFETALDVARTGFDDADATGRTLAFVRRSLAFLYEHAHHEDAVIFPEIARLGPAVFADLQADHHRVEGLQRDLEQVLVRLESAERGERVALGQRLHERLNRLIAEYLVHMDCEETTANRILWAHFDDERLRGMQGQIIGMIPPSRLLEWAGILLPALAPVERAAMLGGLQTVLPAAFLAPIVALAERAESEASV